MGTTSGVDLTARPYRPGDEEGIRQLLRDLLRADPAHPRCWTTPRWDYWVTHRLHNCEWQALDGVVFIWEAADGSIAAVANPEGSGQAFFQVRPGRRSPDLDRAMLDAISNRAVRLSRSRPTPA